MKLTSIKVSTDVRDRVSRLARHEGLSQHAYLDQLLREAEEREFWTRMEEVAADEYRSAIKEDGDELSDDYELEETRIRDDEK